MFETIELFEALLKDDSESKKEELVQKNFEDSFGMIQTNTILNDIYQKIFCK